MDNQSSLVERSKQIKVAAEMGLARSSRGRHWSSALRRRLLQQTGAPCEAEEAVVVPAAAATVGEEGEAMEVERRVRALQRLVPGGEDLAGELLFEEAADYVEALQRQVGAMRALACLLDGSGEVRRLVPGGEDVAGELLFEEAADFAEALQRQVGAMRALACSKRKTMGG